MRLVNPVTKFRCWSLFSASQLIHAVQALILRRAETEASTIRTNTGETTDSLTAAGRCHLHDNNQTGWPTATPTLYSVVTWFHFCLQIFLLSTVDPPSCLEIHFSQPWSLCSSSSRASLNLPWAELVMEEGRYRRKGQANLCSSTQHQIRHFPTHPPFQYPNPYTDTHTEAQSSCWNKMPKKLCCWLTKIQTKVISVLCEPPITSKTSISLSLWG